MLNFFYFLSMGLFVFICLFLILLVLIQKGRGGGLSGAFGGGGGGSSAFGSKTGDVLTWTTAVVFLIFLLLAIALNLLADRHQHKTAPSLDVLTSSPNAPR
jgi:preprotein translocase subunit SecG